MAKPVSIYLKDTTLAALDREVERRGALDRAAGKTGRAVASRSSLIQEYVDSALSCCGGLTRESIEYAVIPLAEEYGAQEVCLFGSYARGEQTAASDVDILLTKGDIRGMKVLEFQDALAGALGCKVDVVTTDGASPRFLSKIEKDLVTLYKKAAG